MKLSHRARRIFAVLSFLLGIFVFVVSNPASYEPIFSDAKSQNFSQSTPNTLKSPQDAPVGSFENSTGMSPSTDNAPNTDARKLLPSIEIKGRAPKTGYTRTQFYKGWPDVDGCSLRQRIIKREFGDKAQLDSKCHVVAGEFLEPYTGKYMVFTSKSQISKALQIDHIVALSDAWQKGAQYHPKSIRYQVATDPLNLVAADGPANMQKSDSDAASWLPANKAFRCQYVARQVAVKYKYRLWASTAEHATFTKILDSCPPQLVPSARAKF